jgi:hypothetical protein
MQGSPVSGDGYVSFRGSQRRDFGELTDKQPVIFVDLDLHGEEGAVLRLPPSFTAQRDAVLLLRLEDFLETGTLPRAVQSSLKAWETIGRIGILNQPINSEPRIEIVQGDALKLEEEVEVLKRARAVELEALLDFGQAIWRPNSHHYRLITGEHAEAYIKLADAIRSPRDAQVLASWLHRYIKPETGILLDTGTLTPLAQAIESAALRSEVKVGLTATLDNYPRTVIDVGATLDRVSGDERQVLIVLSVSSSGALLERIQNAILRKGDSISPQISLLVNKGGEAEIEDVDIWTPLVDQDPLVPSGSPDAVGCRLCKEPGRATVVPINPFTFDAMLPGQFELAVPDIEDPSANRPLWEAAQRTGALAVEQPAHQAVRRYRSDSVPMGIVMRSERVISDQKFRDSLKKRIQAMQKKAAMPTDTDLVLVPEHESTEEGFDAFWEDVGQVLAPDGPQVVPFPTNDPFDEDLKRKIREASCILVFQLGTVSGGTIQRALVGIQAARGRSDQSKLHGFVMHARPATRRELQTIKNSYGREGEQSRLRIGWSSILPDRSPLREEGILLKEIAADSLSPAAKTFHEERSQLCRGGYVRERAPVLWGSDQQSHLTPNAIYGHALDAVTTYVAVGSAMAAALGAPEKMTPELRVFEIAAIARSYYDPLILGSMLRWMRPHEVFWGWTAEEAKTTALHILDRAENLGQSILVPEMLLAAAQGKVTREAAMVAVNAAETLLKSQDTSDETRGILELGLKLASNVESLPSTAALYQPEASKRAE